MRLKGKGAPRRGGGQGDQFVKLKIVLPKSPDTELEAFVSNWDKGKAFNPREDSTSCAHIQLGANWIKMRFNLTLLFKVTTRN